MNHNISHRTPLDAAKVKAVGAVRLPAADGLFKTTSASATLESPVLETPSSFNDVVGSWDAALPTGSRLEMQVQVRTIKGWSAWYSLGWATGSAKGPEFSSAGRQEDETGLVDVDTLKLKEAAQALRYRFLLSAPGRRAVTLKLAALALSDAHSPEAPPAFVPGPWVTELKVPARSQMDEQESYKHDICSPTALAAVLAFWGKNLNVTDVADRVRDRASLLYGNWPANTAFAASQGLETRVARLQSLDELAREVAEGRPVVVSLTFGPGELPGSPIKRTKGHIIVVTGFTEQGDVIVMDPAAPDKTQTRRVYGRAAFHKAWRVNKRGLAYVIGPPLRRKMTVGVPVADLQAGPRQKKKLALDDDDHLSQLLYGETVEVLESKGDWLRVLADEQLDHHEDKAWRGYPGWVRAETLSDVRSAATDVEVRVRQAVVHRGEELIMLSVGTRLARVSDVGGLSTVRLIDGSLAEVPSDALSVPPAVVTDLSRSQIIKTAELFLGTSYYWGGRSGVQIDMSIGVDCSGLVNLAYRIHGIDVPRDSHEQKLRSRPMKRAELLPGDLVFLSDKESSDKITHVMIYTGGDGVIESRQSSGRVLRSSFAERFGKLLSELESGDAVTDLSFPKSKRRQVFFGSYF